MPTIPGGAGAAVALLAALVLCGGGDLTAAELTSFSLLTEAGPSPYSCLSQAYPVRHPPSRRTLCPRPEGVARARLYGEVF